MSFYSGTILLSLYVSTFHILGTGTCSTSPFSLTLNFTLHKTRKIQYAF